MDIIQTVESAAHATVEAVEHPFHTINARLKAIGGHLVAFFGHPYCAPPLAEALSALYGVVVDLTQEVAELRVPCPCKPAPTSAAAPAPAVEAAPEAAAAEPVVQAAPEAPAPAVEAPAAPVEVSAADLADFKAWQAAKASAATGQA